MSKSPRTPKNTIKIRRSLEVGDEIMLPVTITGKRIARPSGSAVEHELLTFRIPGYGTPVTVSRKYLLGEAEED